MPWAPYRTGKGGVKFHMSYRNATGIPDVVDVSPAKVHDIAFLRNQNYQKGTILVMDRAYNDFSLFNEWCKSGVFFVTRMKDGTVYTVVKDRALPPVPEGLYGGDRDALGPKRTKKPFEVVKDQIIRLSSNKARKACPARLRLVTARDPETGDEFRYITNLPPKKVSCHVVAAIYRERWAIETFFKLIKQNLVIKKFMGTSENAVRIQIYSALIVLLLIELRRLRSKVKWNFRNLIEILRTDLFTYHSLPVWMDTDFCEGKTGPPPAPPPFEVNKLIG
jgi:hypothetical protein